MYAGKEYRSQVGGYIKLSLRRNARRVRILLIRQRYSDCPIAKVEFWLLFPGCGGFCYPVFLADRNVAAQYAKLRTKDDSNKASIIRELKATLERVKERVAFLVSNGNDLEMKEIERIIKDVCLK